MPKSHQGSEPCLKRAGDAAELSIAPGQRCGLLFEHVGEPVFELEASGVASGAGPASRVAVDLERLAFPASFRWTGSRWVGGSSPSRRGGVSVTLEWHLGAGLAGTAPVEQDPQLRRQLEALGYL